MQCRGTVHPHKRLYGAFTFNKILRGNLNNIFASVDIELNNYRELQ